MRHNLLPQAFYFPFFGPSRNSPSSPKSILPSAKLSLLLVFHMQLLQFRRHRLRLSSYINRLQGTGDGQ
jgi:hypothetical protein